MEIIEPMKPMKCIKMVECRKTGLNTAISLLFP